MKRFVFVIIILCFTSGLFAQKDTSFCKHEVRASFSSSILPTLLWFGFEESPCIANLSVSYFYRPVKWFWVGGNFVNYFGGIMRYNWREYDKNGNFKDFSKSKLQYCAVIAPEIRFTYLDKSSFMFYGALSGGIGMLNGYDNRYQAYPKILPYFQLTYFGFSCYFGKNSSAFLGGELGIGCKNFVQIHGGYRF